ncbi:MAG: hypothetical protein ACOYY2_03045 [Actinomycetota bacterium]
MAQALTDLIDVAEVCRRGARNKRRENVLALLYAAVGTVREAEEALDLAYLDLDTTRGADA